MTAPAPVPIWAGSGACKYAAKQRHPPRCELLWPRRPRRCHEATRPRLAFVVAGASRGFLEHGAFILYHLNVVRSLGGPTTNSELSRVFMHLHVHNSSVPTWLLLKDRLQQAVRLLRPADVVVESIDRMRAPNSFAHPDCHWSDRVSLQTAHTWWSTMANTWRMVVRWEATKRHRFDALIFSRPDIFYEVPMGPWCAYELARMWYSPSNVYTPDMLFFLPRFIARRVLNTLEEILMPCRPGQACCNRTWLGMRSMNPRPTRLPVSWWLVHFWSSELNITVNDTMMGWGAVAANRDSNVRNCTLHVGCVPHWIRYSSVVDQNEVLVQRWLAQAGTESDGTASVLASNGG